MLYEMSLVDAWVEEFNKINPGVALAAQCVACARRGTEGVLHPRSCGTAWANLWDCA